MATVTWDVAAAVITTAGAGAVIAVGASRTNATSGAAFDWRLRNVSSSAPRAHQSGSP
ncbi:hypothetical protein ACVWZV_006389 [Bradyrhizobium sp. GM5.1]|jgi:hypothetical protein